MAVYEKKEKGAVFSGESKTSAEKSSTSSSSSNINKKSRSWTWVIYDEQIDFVRQYLASSPDIAWVMSPKHDRDIQPTGEPKKPHWHLVISWHGPITYKAALDISNELKLPIPQAVRNTRTMIRYFLHLDDADKAKYDRNDITSGGGFEVNDYLVLSQSEKDAEELNFVSQLVNKVIELDLNEFFEVTNFVLSEMPENYQYFKKNSYVIKNYIMSKSLGGKNNDKK